MVLAGKSQAIPGFEQRQRSRQNFSHRARWFQAAEADKTESSFDEGIGRDARAFQRLASRNSFSSDLRALQLFHRLRRGPIGRQARKERGSPITDEPPAKRKIA